MIIDIVRLMATIFVTVFYLLPLFFVPIFVSTLFLSFVIFFKQGSVFSFIYFYLFIYFGCIGSSLWHLGSLLQHAGSFFVVAAHGLFVAVCGLLSSCGLWVFSL